MCHIVPTYPRFSLSAESLFSIGFACKSGAKRSLLPTQASKTDISPTCFNQTSPAFPLHSQKHTISTKRPTEGCIRLAVLVATQLEKRDGPHPLEPHTKTQFPQENHSYNQNKLGEISSLAGGMEAG
ncbi:hypothetical protein NMY22_g9658 [Coprinellus aureogranulatus]|nr:hypothetical protein NMY22_g9658 [Coprinellus aureogranulatus]